ncbi:hypothetical protein Tco_1085087 [Tanacetum coccineum]
MIPITSIHPILLQPTRIYHQSPGNSATTQQYTDKGVFGNWFYIEFLEELWLILQVYGLLGSGKGWMRYEDDGESREFNGGEWWYSIVV